MKYTPKDGFPYYYEWAKEDDLKSIFLAMPTLSLLQSIDEEKANFRYAPNKWSIKQVVGHITDHERIKMFRAFQLSRNEKVQLWGYDQEFLVKNSRFNDLSIISTLVLLQTRKVIKAITISERFDISLRTVYRDIRTLKNAGIPIIGDPGIGYSIMDGYRMPPIMFNEGEAAALLTAEKFIAKLKDQDTQDYYSSAMMKIKAILRSSEKQSLA